MMVREQDKHFLWSLYVAVAIIFTWKGLWEGIYEIPYIGDPFVFLFIGLVMLTFSGVIFKEFDPLGGINKAVFAIISHIKADPHKQEYVLKYYDKERKKHLTIDARRIRRVEKGAVVLKHHAKNQEVFIPAHRITEVLYKGKRYWRL